MSIYLKLFLSLEYRICIFGPPFNILYVFMSIISKIITQVFVRFISGCLKPIMKQDFVIERVEGSLFDAATDKDKFFYFSYTINLTPLHR